MAFALEQPHGPSADTLLRAKRAFIAVNEVDRIILTSSGGNLQPLLPLDPFHGIHRAYAWQGVGPPYFVQVNATAVRRSYGRCEWTWPAGQIHSHRRLFNIAVIADPLTGQLEDPAWIFPSTTFKRIAYFSEGPRTRPQYWIMASPTGHDRFARNRVGLGEIWKLLAPSSEEREQFAGLAGESTRDQGTTYEQLVAARLILKSGGAFALYRPGMDIAGRDLLVHLLGTSRALYLQIKGTTMIVRGTRIQFLVKRWTFRPSADFWLAFYYFDAAAGDLGKYCWLVPSLDFAALTADQHFARSISFQVTLDGEDNRWFKYRHEIDEQAEVLRKVLS